MRTNNSPDSTRSRGPPATPVTPSGVSVPGVVCRRACTPIELKSATYAVAPSGDSSKPEMLGTSARLPRQPEGLLPGRYSTHARNVSAPVLGFLSKVATPSRRAAATVVPSAETCRNADAAPGPRRTDR